jgi:hypothetical protein
MNRGSGGWIWFLFLAIIGVIIYGIVTFGPPYFHKACLENKMEEFMRQYGTLGEEEMIDMIIKVAGKDCKVFKLRYENFDFDGAVMEDSVLSCHNTEVIRLPGDRFYKIDMNPEVRIRIPTAF